MIPDTRSLPRSARTAASFILSEALKIHKHCSGPQGRGAKKRLARKLLTYSHGGFSEQCVILIVAFSSRLHVKVKWNHCEAEFGVRAKESCMPEIVLTCPV